MPDESKDLLVPIPIASPLAVFTEPNGLDPYLKRVRDAIDAWEYPGVDTRKGRDEIAAFAYKISRSKTALEDAGKELATAQKEIPRKIDAARKSMRDTLDAWRDEVRAPLSRWEEAESKRITTHLNNISQLTFWCDRAHTMEKTAAQLREALEKVQNIKCTQELCEEYELDYVHAKTAAIAALTKDIEAHEQYESEQAELARLREEKLVREQADREANIAREAAEHAALVEQARHECAMAAAREETRRAEFRALEAQKQAEAAQERARRQVEEDKRLEAEEAAQRAADARHKAAIHQEAFIALQRELDNGLELTWRDGTYAPAISKFVLRLITDGKIPHVRFVY